MMNILVINSGSSSIKYQYFLSGERTPRARGLVERIDIEGSRITHRKQGADKVVRELGTIDHHEGIHVILDILAEPEIGVIKSLQDIDAVGHRVVHGAEYFSEAVIIDDEALHRIELCTELAPLHNPPNLLGIRAIKDYLPHVPNVAVFDTTFHSTVPEYAHIYPVPYHYYKDYKIRRYGFHGPSHNFVSYEAAKLVGRDRADMKIVTCHLGNGCSLSAVDRGHSVDTSLGFGTMSGVPMSSRAGDIDPAVILHIMEKDGLSPEQMKKIIYKESGMLGISGVSSDMRDIEEAAAEGHHLAELALEIFAYSTRKYIGAYAAAMDGLDMIVFTGGIGENGWEMRQMILEKMTYFGIDLDVEANKVRGKAAVITKPGSRAFAVVMPTNEELMIARETERLTKIGG